MATKISDLAKKLGLSDKVLKAKITELGFAFKPKTNEVDDDVAALISDEINKPEDIAEIYDELIAKEQEKEIIKSQRKKTAGKDDGVKKKKAEDVKIVPSGTVPIPETISVKEFAEKTGINVAKVIGELMRNGILANINQQIDFDTAQIIADDLGLKLKRIRSVALAKDFLTGDISNLIKEDDPSMLKVRPPVVCVMGHVDHGKTKLLDAIRETHVVDGESGGITQHIGAYQVEKKGKLITFLDTPGHEAFTAMRARGAKVTDIAILVVAADEGIKPQTVEAMNHAKDAKVPIIVALNKIDKPGANIDKVKGELSEHGLQPEDWGGQTVTVPVSAVTKAGIDDLLDMILLTAEMENLRANPDREAIGTVIEAHLDQRLGPVATILVNTGTLNKGDHIIVGHTYGRVKLMMDYIGKNINSAKPSTPVKIAGLHITPRSGDILQVVKNEKAAKERAEEITLINKKEREDQLSASNQVISKVKADKILKLIIKADMKGSLEAIKQSISKIKDDEVAIKMIHTGVGRVTESDVMMASASHALVVAFHSNFDSPNVKTTAERERVEVKRYMVIYDLLEDIKKILSGFLEPEIERIVIGRAEVRQIFLNKKKDMIIGCRVKNGKIKSNAKLNVIRGKNAEGEENVVGSGVIESLRKVDETVKEVNEGNDCGIKFRGDVRVEEGDVLEVFDEKEIRRTIS